MVALITRIVKCIPHQPDKPSQKFRTGDYRTVRMSGQRSGEVTIDITCVPVRGPMPRISLCIAERLSSLRWEAFPKKFSKQLKLKIVYTYVISVNKKAVVIESSSLTTHGKLVRAHRHCCNIIMYYINSRHFIGVTIIHVCWNMPFISHSLETRLRVCRMLMTPWSKWIVIRWS
jgi:hypothetical protein